MTEPARRRGCQAQRGFTLLEVMVAVAILGLGLTAILSAQFGAMNGVYHARGMSGAVGYARCKMTELEAHVEHDGFAELDEHDSGPCCGNRSPGYTCDWRLEKPSFPDGTSAKLDLDTGSLGALGKLAGGASGAAPSTGAGPGATGGLGGITDALGPGAGQLAAGGIGGIASTVMGMVYPSLKRVFEASSRRITVVIHWDERGRDHSFDVVQWVTKPQIGAGAASGPEDLTGLGTAAAKPGTTGPAR